MCDEEGDQLKQNIKKMGEQFVQRKRGVMIFGDDVVPAARRALIDCVCAYVKHVAGVDPVIDQGYEDDLWVVRIKLPE